MGKLSEIVQQNFREGDVDWEQGCKDTAHLLRILADQMEKGEVHAILIASVGGGRNHMDQEECISYGTGGCSGCVDFLEGQVVNELLSRKIIEAFENERAEH